MTTLYIHNPFGLTVLFFCFKMKLPAIPIWWVWRRTLTISTGTTETIRWSHDTVGRTVLVASSLNLETVALVPEEYIQHIIDQSAEHIVRDRKISVASLVIYDAYDGGKEARVTFPPTGHTQVIRLGQTVSDHVAAGSSANVANALRQMGTQDTGIIGAVGGGADGSTLIHSLTVRGFNDLLLVRRGGTAQSLFLKTPDGTTIIFSLKPPYSVTEAVLQYLKETVTARIIVCSGFMPFEFPLIQALLNTEAEPKARVMSPHRGCFTNTEDRKQCLTFAEQADLFHINGIELQELLGIDHDWEKKSDEAVCDLLRRIPARLVCITMNSSGSVTYVRSRNRLIRQSSSGVKNTNSPIGAGDVHLAALIWYLWLRERKIKLEAALKASTWIAARKIEFSGLTPRPWDGIPESDKRKEIVHQAEGEFKNAPEWEATPAKGS